MAYYHFCQRIAYAALLISSALSTRGLCESNSVAIPAESAAARDARMKWWRDARFGMFIHWGLYSLPAGEWNGKKFPGASEWIMDYADIPVKDYEQLAPKFNPARFDPKKWVQIAKDAGVKYVVITSKHHDGFCMFDTNTTNWDIVDASPYRKDVLSPLASECRKCGIKFCVYYSIMDWHHPAQAPSDQGYNPTVINPNRKGEYVDNMRDQLKELLESCDPEVIWFDGEWPDWWSEKDGRSLYTWLRTLKPSLIINNRVGKGRDGMVGLNKDGGVYVGDFGTPEQQIPATGLPDVDWESCMTMNGSWGFHKSDHNWKSSESLVRNLVDITSKGGNYLLNVGPTSDGEIPDSSVERLEDIGEWMRTNGESIYETSASPFGELPWGRCTMKHANDRTTLYLHVFQWPTDGQLRVAGIKTEVNSARLLNNGSSLAVQQNAGGATISIPISPPDKIDTVITVECEGRIGGSTTD